MTGRPARRIIFMESVSRIRDVLCRRSSVSAPESQNQSHTPGPDPALVDWPGANIIAEVARPAYKRGLSHDISARYAAVWCRYLSDGELAAAAEQLFLLRHDTEHEVLLDGGHHAKVRYALIREVTDGLRTSILDRLEVRGVIPSREAWAEVRHPLVQFWMIGTLLAARGNALPESWMGAFDPSAYLSPMWEERAARVGGDDTRAGLLRKQIRPTTTAKSQAAVGAFQA
jgi:hypothetical protein